MNIDVEKEIIERVLGGDKNAFEGLVLENQKNVYNLALKMTRNEEDALDVSQEAFVKAYRQLRNFRGDSRFSVWLYRLTYNLCIDFLRKKPKTNMVSLSYDDDSGDTAPLEIPDLRSLPEDSTIRNELRKGITESIKELPLKHREVIVMREISDMSYDDIATTLKINVGTVKSRLARARLKLIDILKEKGTFPDNYRLKMQKEVEQDEN
ncbi:MAG: sigma-70 family RNA polymerase sigma factor [Oscillospiraceae bacterium]|nr:sigma-70 family RNA polymerase sigma factor [Oscillospiraceae bacterium]